MKSFFITLLLILISSISFANVETYFMSSSFNSPGGSYVEYYFITIGNSIEFLKKDNNNYQGEIEVTMIFKSKDSIVAFNKYSLFSPEITEEMLSNMKFPNFIDVQRIVLDNGVYDVEISVLDKNREKSKIVYNEKLIVDFPNDRISFSDFEFVEKVEKSQTTSILSRGEYDIYPYVSDYYPSSLDRLKFYLEIYNTDEFVKEDFVLRYYLEYFESGTQVADYSAFKRLKSANVIPVIGEFNIENLYSGNYLLVAEIKDKENNLLLKTKRFFQRNNPNEKLMQDLAEKAKDMDLKRVFAGDLNNIDSLREYISCLHPVATIDEKTFINIKSKKNNIDELQGFFVAFWLKRNPITPGDDWRRYKEQVDFIDKHYSTPIHKGYSTERGRVYLQYGAPNDIYVSPHEPNAYPYEIWTYHRVAGENNRKFIFYNRNIAGNEFELLHSDLTGEIRNPHWELFLNKRNEPEGNYDYTNPRVDETWGSRARQVYDTK